MSDFSDSLARLRQILRGISPGPISEGQAPELREALATAWEEFDGADVTSMEAFKVADRAYRFRWEPPVLIFEIERHGGLVMGSTRAERQGWRIDMRRAPLPRRRSAIVSFTYRLGVGTRAQRPGKSRS